MCAWFLLRLRRLKWDERGRRHSSLSLSLQVLNLSFIWAKEIAANYGNNSWGTPQWSSLSCGLVERMAFGSYSERDHQNSWSGMFFPCRGSAACFFEVKPAQLHVGLQLYNCLQLWKSSFEATRQRKTRARDDEREGEIERSDVMVSHAATITILPKRQVLR